MQDSLLFNLLWTFWSFFWILFNKSIKKWWFCVPIQPHLPSPQWYRFNNNIRILEYFKCINSEIWELKKIKSWIFVIESDNVKIGFIINIFKTWKTNFFISFRTSCILDVTPDSSIQDIASIEILSRRNDGAVNVCLPRVGLRSHDLWSYISWNWHGRGRDSWRGEVTLTTEIARKIRREARKTRPAS